MRFVIFRAGMEYWAGVDGVDVGSIDGDFVWEVLRSVEFLEISDFILRNRGPLVSDVKGIIELEP